MHLTKFCLDVALTLLNTNLTTATSLNNKILNSKCKALCNILNNHIGCSNVTIEEVRYKRTEIKATETSELQLYIKKNLIEQFTDESKRHIFSWQICYLDIQNSLTFNYTEK